MKLGNKSTIRNKKMGKMLCQRNRIITKMLHPSSKHYDILEPCHTKIQQNKKQQPEHTMKEIKPCFLAVLEIEEIDLGYLY